MQELIVIREADLETLKSQMSALFSKVDRLTSQIEEPVSIKFVAEHLNVSVKTVQRKMAEGLPFHKFGQLDRFYLSEINEWLKSQ